MKNPGEWFSDPVRNIAGMVSFSHSVLRVFAAVMCATDNELDLKDAGLASKTCRPYDIINSMIRGWNRKTTGKGANVSTENGFKEFCRMKYSQEMASILYGVLLKVDPKKTSGENADMIVSL